MEPGSATIQTTDLTKRFGSFTAVDSVSFEVRRGDKSLTIKVKVGVRPEALP